MRCPFGECNQSRHGSLLDRSVITTPSGTQIVFYEYNAWVDSETEMIGFIHSHPETEEGKYNDFPSEPDLFLLHLPGISEIYVVPYENCETTSSTIKATDRIVWEH